MWRSHRTSPAALAFLAAVAFVATAAAHAATLTPVWLSVHSNPFAEGQDTLLLADETGELWASESSLREWGVVAPSGAGTTVDGVRWYGLLLQPGMHQRLDEASQSLWLDVDPGLRTIQVRGLAVAPEAPRRDDSAEPGGWLDLDVNARRQRSGTTLGGLVALDAFYRLGLGNATALLDDGRPVRLDTTYTIDRPDDLERIAYGDGITGSGAFGIASRFAGMSWGTDFRLQPDLVTFPLPSMRGVARLPSTLDVYVDGLLARREPIGEGPFELHDIPVQTGQGEARVVVRDLLGREQTLSQPFFASARLLRPGLTDWRFDGGWLRENYGLRSNDYGTGFAAFDLRRGWSPTLTLDGRAETGARRQAVGGGADAALPFAGLGSLALAASRDDRRSGALLLAGADFTRGASGGTLSFGARLRRSTGGWTDLGEDRPSHRRDESAHLAFAPFPGCSAGFAWSRMRMSDAPRARIASLDASARIAGTWFVTANVARIEQAGGSWFAGVNLVGRFGGGTWIGGSTRDAGRANQTVEWQSDVRDALDDRYRVRGRQGDDPSLGAESALQFERGSVIAGLARDRNETGVQLGAATRVAWLGGDAFWTRPGPDGFAVVDAHGLSGVGVLQDHRLAAHTDSRGLALIPGLRPYQRNQLSLADADIPIDAQVGALDKVVVPPGRGGLRVDFPVGADNGHRARLAMPDGTPVPGRSRVRDDATGVRLAVGDDGTVWWKLGELPSSLVVEVDGRRCRADLRGVKDDTQVVRLVCGT